MSENGGHLTREVIAPYLARTLDAAAIAALHGHVAGCAACARLLADSASRTAHAGPAHLTEQELVDFVAGKATAAWTAEHIANCELCAAQAEDLRVFAESDEAAPASFRGRYWGLAAAAALILLSGLGAWLVLQRRADPALLADAGGPVTLATLTAEPDLVRKVLLEGRLPPIPPSLAAAPDAVRGAQPPGPAIAVGSPAGKRVLLARPEFKWTPCPGGTYQVGVFDENFNEIARSRQVDGTVWQPAEDLPRGNTLFWQVSGVCGGRRVLAPAPPEPPARFEVVQREMADRIERARGSHLALASLYAAAGLRDEAAAEIDALSRLNPASPLVDSLRRSLAK